MSPSLPRIRWSYPLCKAAVASRSSYPNEAVIGFTLNPAHLRLQKVCEVFAPLSGKVTQVTGYSSLGADVYRVEILSDAAGVARIFNILSALDSLEVDTGDVISQGETIGHASGDLSWSSYLNFYKNPGGRFVLPTDIASQMGGIEYLR